MDNKFDLSVDYYVFRAYTLYVQSIAILNVWSYFQVHWLQFFFGKCCGGWNTDSGASNQSKSNVIIVRCARRLLTVIDSLLYRVRNCGRSSCDMHCNVMAKGKMPAGARPPACGAKAGGAERPRRAACRPAEIGWPPLSNRGVQ